VLTGYRNLSKAKLYPHTKFLPNTPRG